MFPTRMIFSSGNLEPQRFGLARPSLAVRYPAIQRFTARLLLLLVACCGSGCGSFFAHRMAQAPNTYPSWLAPRARVLLSFDENCLTNFPAHFVDVGPPPAQVHYRIVPPAEYGFQMVSTNWMERGKMRFQFTIDAKVPGRTNIWSSQPRGTVVLLHGYGLAEFAMVPWALRLAQSGWRCVLVDLRGHGKSTGRIVYYGVHETRDMSQLLDALARQGLLAPPVSALGESYGAALALRWKASDARLDRAVAIAPYAVLSNAVMNICREYAPCLPRAFVRAGLKRLPAVLGVQPDELDPVTVLAEHPVVALFITGTEDNIAPPAEVQKLFDVSPPGSRLISVPDATHETVPYRFHDLVGPVLEWLTSPSRKSHAEGTDSTP